MSRSFLPREHGAYGQLGVPLAAALGSGRPGLAAIALTLGVIVMFLTHEPLLRFAMRRGGRARQTARTARQIEHSLPGELVLATALAGAAVPVAIACGVAPSSAMWTWVAWAVGFGAVTCAVHAAVIKRRRRDPLAGRTVGLVFVAVAIALAIARPVPVMAVLPLVVAAIALHALAPSPRRVRQVGWTLMTATMAAGTWTVIATRLAG